MQGRTVAAATAAVVLFAAWLKGYVHPAPGDAMGAPGVTATSAPGADERPTPVYAAHTPLGHARPLSIEIPSAGIDAPLVARGLTADGAIDPPPFSSPQVAGWFGAGPAPGDAGAALIVGHVDTRTRAAVFYNLSTVTPGTLVEINRSDGSVAEFTVEGVEIVPKEGFRPDRVYGSGVRPELRLITCGGTFDHATQSYSANVVVYAALTGSHTRA
ncbi:class F sortase [Streptomyces sp. NPDC088354]|uniref:class F sortase n=1 Tax=unclassified Streptomyces TaxID=2593676 RepID=UPI0029A076DA|nr:class F sortase [Streptomyces sp. MI02-7b]MDX3077250.1 class F sortase [Streptomyces sp. MI02-7b]